MTHWGNLAMQALTGMTILFIDLPYLVGWAAGMRDGRLLILVDRELPARLQKLNALEAMTDCEYDMFEQSLPVAEIARRAELTWGWRDLPRREAMLMHLGQHSDQSYDRYESGLPLTERARRAKVRRLARLDAPRRQAVLVP